jgi:hypothetical protein
MMPICAFAQGDKGMPLEFLDRILVIAYTHTVICQIDEAARCPRTCVELCIRHLRFARRFMLGVWAACVYSSDTIGVADRTPGPVLVQANLSEFNRTS